MTDFGIAARQTGPLPSLVKPPATPAAQPTEQTALGPTALPDQVLMSYQSPVAGDMGSLPQAADPGTSFMGTAEFRQLSDQVHAMLMTFSTAGSHLSQSSEDGTFTAGNEDVQELLEWLDTLNQPRFDPSPGIEASAGETAHVPPASPPRLAEMRLAGRGQLG